MKKLIPLVLVASLGFSGLAAADSHNRGGFNDGNNGYHYNVGGFQGGLASAITVEQAKQLPDDAWVTLRGNLTQQISKDEYTFKDSTGEIVVEIDKKRWRGLTVSPSDVVEITGEVDKGWNKVEIDVKQIKLAQPATPAK